MKIAVKVTPREVILDTQGRAVEENLRHQGISISGCKVGKYIVLDLPYSNEQEAMVEAKKIAEYVLYNPLIENYSLEKLS